MQETMKNCSFCGAEIQAIAQRCWSCGRDQAGGLSRAYKIDFVAPVLLLFLLFSYFLHWQTSSSSGWYTTSAKNGFELWGKILDRNSTSGPAAMFLILLALSTLAIFALYIVNLVHSPSGSESSNRGMLHVHWIRGGAAILASFSSFIPAFMMADRIGSNTPGAGFVISILVSIGLFISGTVSIILAAIALNRAGPPAMVPAAPAAPPERVVCPQCRILLDEGANYCKGCGARRQASRPVAVCANCNMALDPGAKFCGGCGTPCR